jgi:hypothetical protein
VTVTRKPRQVWGLGDVAEQCDEIGCEQL